MEDVVVPVEQSHLDALGKVLGIRGLEAPCGDLPDDLRQEVEVFRRRDIRCVAHTPITDRREEPNTLGRV
jgi:hypothetical protein